MDALIAHLPPLLVGFVLTLALGLLIGFEREEHREPDGSSPGHFGGVRTFPIIAVVGFLLVAAFPHSPLPFFGGLLVMGALLTAGLYLTGSRDGDIGITSESAALLAYTLGAAAASGLYWISIAAGVIAVMLLQQKRALEGLAARVPRHEFATLARFLLITGVILPAVPNRAFTQFEINPFKIWLVVVAVGAVSYASYLLQLRWGGSRGLLLAGLLGGAYSSTVTTVVMARESRTRAHGDRAYAATIAVASGVMYLRLWLLLLLFAPPLAHRLKWVFLPLAAVVVIVGAIAAGARGRRQEDAGRVSRNPLELRSAFAFAAVFLAVLVATRAVADRFGDAGLLLLAGVMGLADVDPFILGVAQLAGHGLDLGTAALAVVVAAAANNLVKGVYATVFGVRAMGLTALAALVVAAVASLVLYAVT